MGEEIMNQEFKIGNFKLIQDEDGYAIRKIIEGNMYEAIATLKYAEDSVAYFNNIIMEAVAYQYNQQTKQVITNISKEENEDTSI